MVENRILCWISNVWRIIYINLCLKKTQWNQTTNVADNSIAISAIVPIKFFSPVHVWACACNTIRPDFSCFEIVFETSRMSFWEITKNSCWIRAVVNTGRKIENPRTTHVLCIILLLYNINVYLLLYYDFLAVGRPQCFLYSTLPQRSRVRQKPVETRRVNGRR